MMLYNFPFDVEARRLKARASSSGDDGGTDDDGTGYESIGDSLMTTFLMVLGEFDADTFQSTISPNFTLWLFIAFNMAVVLVCLNAVIALLGDSYSSVMERSEAVYCRETAELIVEYLDTMPVSSRIEVRVLLHLYFQKAPICFVLQDLSIWIVAISILFAVVMFSIIVVMKCAGRERLSLGSRSRPLVQA